MRLLRTLTIILCSLTKLGIGQPSGPAIYPIADFQVLNDDKILLIWRGDCSTHKEHGAIYYYNFKICDLSDSLDLHKSKYKGKDHCYINTDLQPTKYIFKSELIGKDSILLYAYSAVDCSKFYYQPYRIVYKKTGASYLTNATEYNRHLFGGPDKTLRPKQAGATNEKELKSEIHSFVKNNYHLPDKSSYYHLDFKNINDSTAIDSFAQIRISGIKNYFTAYPKPQAQVSDTLTITKEADNGIQWQLKLFGSYYVLNDNQHQCFNETTQTDKPTGRMFQKGLFIARQADKYFILYHIAGFDSFGYLKTYPYLLVVDNNGKIERRMEI